MPNVKAVAIRRSGGSMTNRIMTTPKSVNVLQEGLRASDSMTMMLSGEHIVEQGDEIFYIQDVLDVTNLKAVWNFYGGFRDESGYEHDDVYAGDFHTMPNCVNSTLVSSISEIDWAHKGYYKFNINAGSNDGVQIEKKFKNNDTSVSKIPVIDMSGDFDMIFQFKTTNATDGQTLFDNYDHATLSGVGLKIVINPTSTNITITADDGTTETIMVAGSITTNGVVTFVRISRQGGVFNLYLDGVEKTLTNSTNAGNLNSNQNIHFFKEYNESTSAYLASTGWYGVPIQFRFYNTVLLDDEVKKLRISKPVNTTMKFGGRIWKVEDKGSTKKLSCSSFAKELLGTHITSNTFGGTPLDTNIGSVSPGARSYNRYYQSGANVNTRPQMEDILTDILKYVDGGVYTYFSRDPSTSFQGDFFAEGSLLDIIKVMMMVDGDDHMFVVTPRKVLFISQETETNQVISNQNYDIVDSGKDDTGTTNSMFTTGRKKLYTHSKDFGTLTHSAQYTWTASQSWTETTGYTPVVERIIKVTRNGTSLTTTGSGTFDITQLWNNVISSGTIDGVALNDSQIDALQVNISAEDQYHTLTGTTLYVLFTIATEIFAESDQLSNAVSSSFGSNTFRLNDDNTVQFWNEDDTSNHAYVMIYEYTYTYRKADFATFGGSSLQWSTTQHKQDSTSITTNGVYHRNFHVPQLASGFDIATFNTNYIADFKDINTRERAITSSLVNSLTVGQKVRYTDSTGTTDKVVRSIEYSYPQTLTVIELGEYMFSGFDVEKQTIDSLRSLDSSVSITKY